MNFQDMESTSFILGCLYPIIGYILLRIKGSVSFVFIPILIGLWILLNSFMGWVVHLLMTIIFGIIPFYTDTIELLATFVSLSIIGSLAFIFAAKGFSSFQPSDRTLTICTVVLVVCSLIPPLFLPFSLGGSMGISLTAESYQTLFYSIVIWQLGMTGILLLNKNPDANATV
ncbi:MAG: hypothetical protein JWL80_597 [Parcubacteria group bacterium]|nr:hypothetical protein [Parcubacteria group bacterium]